MPSVQCVDGGAQSGVAASCAVQGERRVVVTGMGVVSSVGCELHTFFDNLCAGKSGISAIESFDTEGWSTRIAGEVKDFSVGDLVSKKMARRLDRCVQFTLVAGKKALLDADLPLHIRCPPLPLPPAPNPPTSVSTGTDLSVSLECRGRSLTARARQL
jgi:Beta-ketoacyl synthase, N-terminal domain